ncbi:MAG TPA: hypothetical protein VGM68_03335 [Rhizomicrobium sp.]|jgi:hypothetical protein
MNAKFLALLAAALLVSGSAMAQEMREPAPKCEAMVAPPPALAGWTNKSDVASATKADGLTQAALTIDKGATVALHPTRDVSYIAQPDKPGGSVSNGGLLAVSIATAGTYQINLSSGAWIDLLQDGKAVLSTAHAPGPACTGIRKTVQFPLQPGRYVLQLSANAAPDIQVMVSRVQ